MPPPRQSAWTSRRNSLVGLAALAVTPTVQGQLERALRAARRAGVPRRSLVELALMLRLYAGYPAAIEFLRALATTWPARTAFRQPASYESWRAWKRAGERLCERVYGPGYARLRTFMKGLNSDLDSWMILEGYGKTLTRKGLTLAERELATVSALAALGWSRQLAAHVTGAGRVGAPRSHVARAERAGLRCRRASGS